MRWIKSSFISVILVAIAIVGLMAIVYSVSLGGWKALSVQTGSMRPAIKPGDLVLVKKVPAPSIKVGDVITYINPQDGKSTITHRVTGIIGTGSSLRTFIVKGDANAAADSPVPQTKVLGVAEHQIPYAGHIVDFTRHPIGLILIIYIPALAIIISELRRLAAHYKKQQKYTAFGYKPPKPSGSSGYINTSVIVGLVMAIGMAAYPVSKAFAALQVQATLTGNTITSLAPDPPTPPTPPLSSTCTVTNNTNGSVTTTSTQTATTGNATNAGNTTGQGATSGDARNNSSSNVSITVNNQTGCTP